MPVVTVGPATVHVDAEGFLTEYDEWNEGLAEQLAAKIGFAGCGERQKFGGLRQPGVVGMQSFSEVL